MFSGRFSPSKTYRAGETPRPGDQDSIQENEIATSGFRFQRDSWDKSLFSLWT